MNEPEFEYRYKTLGAQGTVTLHVEHVECDTRSYLGRWKTQTPYASISPHSIQTWYTDTVSAYLAGLSGAFAVAFGFLAIAGRSSGQWQIASPDLFSGIMFAVCVVGFFHFLRNLKSEWIIFPTSIDGHRIAYLRTRKSTARFDDFTDRLRTHIASAANLENGG